MSNQEDRLDSGGLLYVFQRLKSIFTGMFPAKGDVIDASEKGVAGGVAELDANGFVPSSQLPSYVDDVLEFDTKSVASLREWVPGGIYAVGDLVKVTTGAVVKGYVCIVATSKATFDPEEWRDATEFPAEGENGKIYIAKDTNITYRWGGSVYVAIGSDLALGETENTAYRGDRGKAAYDHSQAKGSAYANGLYKITTNSEGHVTNAYEVVKNDITALGIPGQDTTYENATEYEAGLMSAADKAKLDGAVTGIEMNGSAMSEDENGVVDLGTVITAHQDISGKADKVQSATNGNFAALDGNGNLTDSGHKHSDYVTDVSGKADKVQSAVSGNLAGLDGNGNLTDSGKSASDFVASDQGSQNEGKVLGINAQGEVEPISVTMDDFTGATGSTGGAHGLVPAPAAGDQRKSLIGNGTWGYNILEYDALNFNSWDEWIPGQSYTVGNTVKVTTTEGNETTVTGYVCIADNSSTVIDPEEWRTADKFPATGENNRIYIATTSNVTYRWGGSSYIAIGGGGGGGSGSVTLTFASLTGDYNLTATKGSTVVIDMEWASLEDEEPTGNGTLTLTMGNVVRYTKGVAQGQLHEDVTRYLNDGANTLKYTITDTYGNVKIRTWTVDLLNLSITSSFDDTIPYDGNILFTYVAYGDLRKTVHFKMDGTEIATDTFDTYGRQRSVTLEAQEHGDHILEVYYTGTVNETAVTSNTLKYDIICLESGETDPVISADYFVTTVDQYSNIQIPYIVYTPGSQVSDVTIAVNGTTVQSLEDVDRTRQTFSTRMDTSGTNTITISSGGTTKTITLTVNEVTIDVEPETEGQKLYLSSYGRSNLEQNPAVWTYGEGQSQIACTFSGFNWVSDGWLPDDEGITVMRVGGDARITIPYKPFETDKRTSGFTFEIDFATRDVLNYDSVILECMDNGRGIQMTSQKFTLTSEGSSISMQFKENEHIRATFVVEKRTSLRLIYCYINGVMSGVVRYPTDDNFAQLTPKNISIGSSYSTMDIYTIRVYDNDLGMQQVEDNWIADTRDGSEMLDRYLRNNIRDTNGNVVISKLPSDLPYMVISCAELPQYKGDKKTCSGYYVDPMQPDKSYSWTGAQIDVQGTSSQYYARKNYKTKYNNGFNMTQSGQTVSKYAMRSNSVPVKTFCYKADVASSEGANNVELAILYNNACPYKTPGEVANPKVRQGIDGFPISIFWENTETSQISFLGKYNFNNDKGTAEVFGFYNDDESWEVKNNTSNRVLWKSDDYTGDDWLNDFEARFPDTDPPYEDPAQLQEFATWIVGCDPNQATGDALSESVTINGVTYTTDSADYRKAKFRDELGNYVEMDSCLFYYLFTELFLMVDSRAKNMFPSFMGTSLEVSE